jgi:alpha-L-rhamnosidase
MKATNLRTEYLVEPLGLGIDRPRFYWNCVGGQTQTAYRIVARRDGATVWDSGVVASSRMTHVEYEGERLGSRDRVEWSVTLWDESHAEGEPVSSWFELGLLEPSDWSARWIRADRTPKKNVRYPVDHFRTSFAARPGVRRARLYATACGVYDAHLNGRRVGEFRLAPGSTDYTRRLQYQAYDVTELLGPDNVLDLRLADGWFRGSLGAFGATNVFGRETKLLCQLEVEYHDGTRETIGTDDEFAWSDDGPLRFADLQDGEVYDATRAPTFAGRARAAAPGPHPTASDNVEPRHQEVFTPVLVTTPSGARVLDFGQNIAGVVSFAVDARRGQHIRLRLGETLDADGEFTQANFQEHRPVKEYNRITELLVMTGNAKKVPGELKPTPLQQVEVICAEGRTSYTTEFAVFGFRYALVDTEIDIDPADFRAIAIYSDMAQSGDFACSNAQVNRFLENTRWSMKGNFLDVPTDCPTRERLGWTGDAQIFFDTAAYLMDVSGFYRKWLRDLQDNQKKSGKVSAVAPYNGFAMVYDSTGMSVGWGDAAVLTPYRFWRRYGDERLLRECYPMMRAYGRYMIGHTGHKSRRAAKANPHNRYVYEKGMHLGEWLEPEEFKEVITATTRTPRTEEATAYLHYTMTHLAEVAAVLGDDEDAALFAEYAEGAKRAYEFLFLQDGVIDTDRQAKLVRPLALGLADEPVRARLEERLVRAVESRDHTIGTGFLSTPFVLPVLTDAGRADVAYRMLENDQAPSWLAEVAAGATTVWEDWEGKDSHNHYSPGAVCQWLFDTVAGIRPAGENRFIIAPVPGGTLTWARGDYASLYGQVRSRWELDGGSVRIQVEVPANCTAEVQLPDGARHEVGAGAHAFTAAVGVAVAR